MLEDIVRERVERVGGRGGREGGKGCQQAQIQFRRRPSCGRPPIFARGEKTFKESVERVVYIVHQLQRREKRQKIPSKSTSSTTVSRRRISLFNIWSWLQS